MSLATMKAATVFVVLLAVGCTTANVNQTEMTLKSLVGRNIADVISERSVYPDSEQRLPSGNVVYRFATEAGGYVDAQGNVRVCRVWLETGPDGVIVRWRYENCK